jgi:hypothetical protein
METRMPDEERQDFPLVGARARQFKRFERDLADWLESADGRFAVWSARRRLGAGGAEPAHDDLSLIGREARRPGRGQ